MTQTSDLRDKPVNRMGFGAMQLAGPHVTGPCLLYTSDAADEL